MLKEKNPIKYKTGVTVFALRKFYFTAYLLNYAACKHELCIYDFRTSKQL